MASPYKTFNSGTKLFSHESPNKFSNFNPNLGLKRKFNDDFEEKDLNSSTNLKIIKKEENLMNFLIKKPKKDY